MKNNRDKTNTKAMSVVSTDDTGNFRTAVLSALGKEQKGQVLSPYGLCSNPPNNSLALAFNVQGIAANTVVIVDDPKNRKKGLAKGETAIVNYLTGAFVLIKADGSIEIQAKAGTAIKLNGDTDFAVAYTDLKVAFDQLVLDFNTFVGVFNVHTQAVSGSTATAPATPGVISAADMSSSKVETVKVP